MRNRLIESKTGGPFQFDVGAVKVSRGAGITLANRLGNEFVTRDCPIRTQFIRRPHETDPVPPMMQILGSGGGRGGDLRLKLYLSLLWTSPGGDNDTQFDAYSWSRLFGLEKPATNGKRRILASLNWLEDRRFVRKERRPGKATVVTILDERGDGSPYSSPVKLGQTGGEPVYRKLAVEYWSNGWASVLSGRAVAFWLVLMDETNSGTKPGSVWLSESQTMAKYAISSHVRQGALRELAHHGLIATKRTYVREPFAMKSSRTDMKILSPGLGLDPVTHHD